MRAWGLLATVLAWGAPAALAGEPLPPPRVVRHPRTEQPAVPPAPASPRRAPPVRPPPPVRATPGGAPAAADDVLGDARALLAPASVAGGPGSGHGLLWRAGAVRLRLDGVLQARLDLRRWSDGGAVPGGARARLALPRAVLRVTADGPASTRARVEVDLAGGGAHDDWRRLAACAGCAGTHPDAAVNTHAFGLLREAWLEHAPSVALGLRAGLLRTPSTRSLMVRPEQQLFPDLSLAAAWTALALPGHTDRPRDLGFLLHGSLAVAGGFDWSLSLASGAGGDQAGAAWRAARWHHPALAGRLEWHLAGGPGYGDGPSELSGGSRDATVGVWAYRQGARLGTSDARGHFFRAGADASFRDGAWSLAGAWTWIEDRDVGGHDDDRSTAWLLQAGRRVAGTPLTLAARWSGVRTRGDRSGRGSASELAAGAAWILGGPGHRLQLEATRLDTGGAGALALDPVAGWPGSLGARASGWRLRLQWQLTL